MRGPTCEQALCKRRHGWVFGRKGYCFCPGLLLPRGVDLLKQGQPRFNQGTWRCVLARLPGVCYTSRLVGPRPRLKPTRLLAGNVPAGAPCCGAEPSELFRARNEARPGAQAGTTQRPGLQ